MSEASMRTTAWRELKREQGYQPITVWLPSQIKNSMVNLAFARHQDLGELIVEAFRAWSPVKGVAAPPSIDLRRVEELIDRKLAAVLATPVLPDAPPLAATPRAPLEKVVRGKRPTREDGRKECARGHLYTGRSCNQCGTLRKQASRRRLAEERRGEVPA
jgi:hypothetical protein